MLPRSFYTGWDNPYADPCAAGWIGVTCSTSGLPTALSLSSQDGLVGTLSPELSSVTSLNSITLRCE
jgi:hypothetical protein